MGKVLRDQSFCTIFSRIFSIQNPTTEHCGSRSCQCEKSRLDVRHSMRDWKEKISEEGVGICLNYVAAEHRSSVKILAVLSIRDIYI